MEHSDQEHQAARPVADQEHEADEVDDLGEHVGHVEELKGFEQVNDIRSGLSPGVR